jgi:hypothetical protein
MRKSKKILIGVVSLIAAVVLIWFAYYLIHFYFYNHYKDYLTSYDYEEGKEFTPIAENTPDVEGMDLAAQNGTLKLYADTETASIAVVDTRNGEIMYSNPPDAEDDAIANRTNKNYMRSQLVVDYFNTSRTQGTYDSYSYCIEKEDQLEVESIENGVRFIYTLGDLTAATGIVPIYISTETLDSVCAALDEDGAKFVRSKFKESSIADDYMEMLESAQNGASQLRRLNRYFEETGFTQEDYNREMEGSGVEGAVPVSFEIPLEYRLVGDSVEVSIPMCAVKENGGGAIFRISLLRFLGAAGTDENGYLLVPNGSGSLINFNNGKTSAAPYSEFVYGMDPLAAELTVRENTENVKMALFGICRDDSSVFATIERGGSLAYISARVSGSINEYNYVYPTFVLRGNEKLAMFGTTGNEADLPIIEKEFYDQNLTVRYTMLTEEHAGYAGAANYYRDRLINEGVLEANGASGDIKFYYDVLGGIEKTKFFLGVRYRGLYAMTSFDEAVEMSNDLAANGITNQVMNYQGWCNGGYHHDVLNKIKVPLRLGGRSGLEELSAAVEANGGSFYADTSFQRVTEVSDRYNIGNETSRYYGAGYVAEFGLVNPSTLRQTSGLGWSENRFFLVSPKFLVRYVEKFTDRIGRYDIGGISLRDLGNQLHSDKRRTNVIDRCEAQDVVEAELQNIEDTGKRVMINDGNDYSFAYADDIINAPLTDNDYYIVDETIPFYEMLIHGCIDYSGSVINLSDTFDRTETVLNLIETGASPHFVFSWENANEMKNTGLSRFYSTTYESWKQEALAVYDEVNGALRYVNGETIVDHVIYDNGVRAVTYSNGVTIYINTGMSNQTVDGVTVPARSYEIGGVH